MPVCEIGLMVKILSEPDAAGLQEQFLRGLTLRWVLFRLSDSHGICYFKKDTKNGGAVTALFL